eukprot:12883886-Prorocentrum_lima.AAC.1
MMVWRPCTYSQGRRTLNALDFVDMLTEDLRFYNVHMAKTAEPHPGTTTVDCFPSKDVKNKKLLYGSGAAMWT